MIYKEYIMDYHNMQKSESWLPHLYLQNVSTTQENFRHVSHEKNNSYFPLYWLFNRDAYNGLW